MSDKVTNAEEAYRHIVSRLPQGPPTDTRWSVTGEEYLEIGGANLRGSYGNTPNEAWANFIDMVDSHINEKAMPGCKVYFRVSPELESFTGDENLDEDFAKLLNVIGHHRIYCRLLVSAKPELPGEGTKTRNAA